MNNVPVHVVVLDDPPIGRWLDMLDDRDVLASVIALSQEIEETDYANLSSISLKVIEAGAAYLFGGMSGCNLEYGEEVEMWADACGIDVNKLQLANLAYELSALLTIPLRWWERGVQIAQRMRGLHRCTSVAFYMPRHGMVHLRNMDWPLEGIREHTVLIEFDCQAGPFTSVAVPGMLGVLSGVAAGRFSATINANCDDTGRWLPNFRGWASTFLLRRMFETCLTYEAALEFLSKAKGIVPFFVQLAGPKRGQACVVAVNPREDNEVYPFKGGPLGVTNHAPGGGYADQEWTEVDEDGDETLYETHSVTRLESIEHAVAVRKPKTLKGALSLLKKPPVWNCLTMQSMALCPKTGAVLLNEC